MNTAAFHSPLADPPQVSVIASAVFWIQDSLLGNVATSVAIIAMTCIGFSMLSGRMNIRHGAAVFLGSFILFGASAISTGLRTSFAVSAPPQMTYDESRQPTYPAATARLENEGGDPYAGASVPDHR
jgi:type IV secretion system protein VirB2